MNFERFAAENGDIILVSGMESDSVRALSNWYVAQGKKVLIICMDADRKDLRFDRLDETVMARNGWTRVKQVPMWPLDP